MKIKLRGKVWKQITPKEYESYVMSSATHYKVAFFKDLFYGELTYFIEIKETPSYPNQKVVKKDE